MNSLFEVIIELKLHYVALLIFVIIFSDWIGYIRLKIRLNKSFRRVRVKSNAFVYRDEDILKKKYELLPYEILTLIKIGLKNNDFERSMFVNIIDIYYKFIITVAVAGFTLGVATLVGTLSFLSDNENEFTGQTEWIENVNSILIAFTSGMKGVTAMLLIGALIVSYATNHLVVLKYKRHLRKKHLNAIKSAQKNMKKSKDHPSAIQYPVQSTSSNRQPFVSQYDRLESHEPTE